MGIVASRAAPRAVHVIRRIANGATLFLLHALMLSLLPSAARAQTCDASLWQHVYHPARLVVKQQCVSVTGTIVDATATRKHPSKDGVRHEGDGDTHGWLRVDPEFADLLNAGNLSNEGGNLVFEVICQFRVKQADAKSACKNFHSNLKIPPVGTRVRITGTYVEDQEHAKWREIHPVTSIEVLDVAAQKLGPPYWHCSSLGDPNDCEIVQNKLDEDGEPILTPLGCFLAKTRITWIFGDRVKYCPRKVKS
jgi:hypothetical protein